MRHYASDETNFKSSTMEHRLDVIRARLSTMLDVKAACRLARFDLLASAAGNEAFLCIIIIIIISYVENNLSTASVRVLASSRGYAFPDYLADYRA